MKILFLHGWSSVPGGVKPTYLKDHGHEIINPALPHEDMAEAVRIAQAEFDKNRPQVVVGSSRGGAVAMNINSGDAKLVLLCPAWKEYGTARTVKPDTVILHSKNDDVVPFADSEELVKKSGLPTSALIEVGTDHRLADQEPRAAMLRVCGGVPAALNTGDVVRAVVWKTAVFGLFCEYLTHEILVLIPEISWIPSFASCEQVAAVGDELAVQIIHIDRQRNKIAGSLIALHPEGDPWHGAWQLGVGDVLEATVVRWVEKADRCGDAGAYLLALRAATGAPSGSRPSTRPRGRSRWPWRHKRRPRAARCPPFGRRTRQESHSAFVAAHVPCGPEPAHVARCRERVESHRHGSGKTP